MKSARREFPVKAVPIVLLLLGLSAVSQAGQSQQEKPPEQVEDPGAFKIGVDVNQVFLSVTARSPGGGFYKGLTRDDFQVLEDGVPQEIVNFVQENVPVSVVLLVDASGSTRDAQASIRRAALHFAESLGPEDRVAIVTFNSQPVLILNWTNKLENIRLALESIYAKGPTVLNDALFVIFDDLLKEVDGKSAVILLTDGIDSGSQVSMSEALDLAARSEALVYIASKLDEYWTSAVGMRAEFTRRGLPIPDEIKDHTILRARRALDRLARVTGGRVLKAEAFSSLTEVYAEVAAELKNQYYLSYIPSNPAKDGRWRNIEVRTRPGIVVRTRPGYYAPLESPAAP